MSVRATNWAWETGRERELSQGKLLTLLKIADHADQDGVCWPGEAHLAEYTAQGDRTVRRHLGELEADDLLHRERAEQTAGRGRAHDRIFLHMDQPANLAGEKRADLPATDDRPTGQPRHDLPATDDIALYREPSEEPSRTKPPVVPQEGDAFAKELFELWRKLTGRSQATKFSPKRRRVIGRRLKDGLTEDQLRRAVIGCANSDWHMKRGKHERREGQRHDELTFILRNIENVERFAEMAGDRGAAGSASKAPFSESPAAVDVWERVKKELRSAVPESTFEIWFEPLLGAGERDGSLVILDSSGGGIATWVERRYRPLIEDTIQKIGEGDYQGFEFIDAEGLELEAA